MRLAPFLLLALAGCAAQPSAARVIALNAAIGQSEATLLRGLGPPATVQQLGGGQRLTYVRTDSVTNPFRPDPSAVPLVDAVGSAFDYPPEATLGRCATSFDVVAGRVTGWSARGPAC